MRYGACLAFGLAVMMVACVSLHVAPAHAAKRVALVIGNNAYENVPALQKAVNDSEAISRELAKLGFDVVTLARKGLSRTRLSPQTGIPTVWNSPVAVDYQGVQREQSVNCNRIATGTAISRAGCTHKSRDW